VVDVDVSDEGKHLAMALQSMGWWWWSEAGGQQEATSSKAHLAY